MSAYTPGPWLAEGWSRKRECSVITANGFAIAGAFYRGGTEPANANAHLIAAAPDMLAALINVEAVLSIVRPRSDMAEYLAALEQVRAAIAKAEGKS